MDMAPLSRLYNFARTIATAFVAAAAPSDAPSSLIVRVD
jgi:hypothetical protein